jgi:putative acyl-CoA dehydrogenase
LKRSGARDARYDQYVASLLQELRHSAGSEVVARHLTERIALAVQGAILLDGAPAVAEAFISSRLATGAPAAFGVLPAGLDHGALIERAFNHA